LIAILISFALTKPASISSEFNLISALYEEGKSMMVSAFNIHSTLLFLTKGADGQTRTQFMDAMGINSLEELHSLLHRYSTMTKYLKEKNTNNCEISSNMFVLTAEGVDITKECQAILPKFNGIKGDLESVDQVNGLVSAYTDGKITEIIDSIGSVESIILNILYFKGQWESKFTFKGYYPFNFSNGNSDDVPYMTLTKDRVPYTKNELYEYVELKYENNLSAGIILPRENVSIRQLISNFDGLFNGLLEDEPYSLKQVIITMPKFKIESSFELKDKLKDFGITNAFNRNADFSNLFADRGQFIDSIIHKTFISVDEEGTTAAAVTAVIVTKSASIRPKPIIFTVDRPFVFIVFDDESQNNLFTAIVEDF